MFEELEEQLLIADVGWKPRVRLSLIRRKAPAANSRYAEALYGLLKDEMGEILAKADEPLNIEGKRLVILMVGVNGG